MKISTGQILRYSLLPGFIPRIRDLVADGFSHVPFLLACVFRSVGLLPDHHPVFDPARRSGLFTVILAAYAGLTFNRRNIDKVAIFFVILSGVVLLFFQLVLLGMAMVASQPVMAALPTFTQVLTLNAHPPTQDIAFILLDRTFGTTGIFNSCVATAVACVTETGRALPVVGAYPMPIHLALHRLLHFYSIGIFIVSVLIIVYMVITVAAETAQTGTPFGRRFNKGWAPIRLIVFLALLAPLNIGIPGRGGLNAAQLITLWSAKIGSNFATNAWIAFNNNLTTTYLGQTNTLIAQPNMPDISQIVQFMYMAKVCQVAENIAYAHAPDGVRAYVVRENQMTSLVPGPNAVLFDTTAFIPARDFMNQSSITIRFGVLDAVRYKNYNGFVNPLCGEITVDIGKVDRFMGPDDDGVFRLQETYFNLIKTLWRDTNIARYAACMHDRIVQKRHDPNCPDWMDEIFARNLLVTYNNFTKAQLNSAIAQHIATGDFTVDAVLRAKGWAGAGIWYNRVARMNRDVASAVQDIPRPGRYPYVAETVANQRRINNPRDTGATSFDPVLSDGTQVQFTRIRDKPIAILFNKAFSFWKAADGFKDNFSSEEQGPLASAINWMFGSSGVYAMRRNTTVHPLAQLSTLGQGMLRAALRNMMIGYGGGLGTALFDGIPASLMGIGESVFTAVGTAFLAMGFVLAYVIPFLPFLYFFFGAAGWAATIFSAIVAVPLWALAHLRIDGEGLSGRLATDGYYLILEIFLRPILLVFGLLASIQIFSSLVMVMNTIFTLVTENAGGFDYQAEKAAIGGSKLNDLRHEFDQFFMSAMYVILCYMMGLGSFKLIDAVPRSILRWMGKSLSSSSLNPGGQIAEGFSSQAYSGISIASQKITGGQLALLLQK